MNKPRLPILTFPLAAVFSMGVANAGCLIPSANQSLSTEEWYQNAKNCVHDAYEQIYAVNSNCSSDSNENDCRKHHFQALQKAIAELKPVTAQFPETQDNEIGKTLRTLLSCPQNGYAMIGTGCMDTDLDKARKNLTTLEGKIADKAKAVKVASDPAWNQQRTAALKNAKTILSNVTLGTDKGGCNPYNADLDRSCVNKAINSVLPELKEAAKGHPELNSVISDLSKPCVGNLTLVNCGYKNVSDKIQSVSNAVDIAFPQAAENASSLASTSSAKPSIQPRVSNSQSRAVRTSNASAVSARSNQARTPASSGTGGFVPDVSGGSSATGGGTGAAVSGLAGSQIPAAAPAPGLNPTGAKAADATAAAIGTPVGGVSSDGNSVTVKPADVCANTKQIDYSKCTFVRFAGAENISNFKSGGNQVQHEDFASSSFNQFNVSCPGGDPQAKAQVCFGTVECQDVSIQDGNCDASAPTQHQGKIIKKMRLEMAVACSPQGKTCDNISAADCADPKKDGQTIQSIDEKDFAKTRRVGSSDVKSGTTQSGDAQK